MFQKYKILQDIVINNSLAFRMKNGGVVLLTYIEISSLEVAPTTLV